MVLLKKSGAIALLALCAVAVPGKASVFLAFSNTVTGGTFTIPGAGNTNTTLGIGALSGVIFNKLTVSFDSVAADNGAWSVTGTGSGNCTNSSGGTMSLVGNTLSLWGAITGAPFANLSSGCNLLASFTDTNGFKGVSSSNGTIGTVSLNNATSISESALLLGDLSVAGNDTPAGLLAGSAIGGTSPTANSSFSANSEQFTFSLTQTPEPVSWLLMGTGLAAMIVMARKKRAAV
jgi:hypothetical protein